MNGRVGKKVSKTVFLAVSEGDGGNDGDPEEIQMEFQLGTKNFRVRRRKYRQRR